MWSYDDHQHEEAFEDDYDADKLRLTWISHRHIFKLVKIIFFNFITNSSFPHIQEEVAIQVGGQGEYCSEELSPTC